MNRTGLASLASILLLLTSCSRLPWRGHSANETNVIFQFEKNLPVVDARLKGKSVRLIVGTATPQSLLKNSTGREVGFALTDHATVRVTPAQISSDLSGIADGVLGFDAFSRYVLTIDYARQLMTLSRSSPDRDFHRYQFRAEPRVVIVVDGTPVEVIVDTSSPDALTIPGSSLGRRSARMELGGLVFTDEVAVRPDSMPRIGNRILARFLLTIDYGRGTVGLWADPRPATLPADAKT